MDKSKSAGGFGWFKCNTIPSVVTTYYINPYISDIAITQEGKKWLEKKKKDSVDKYNSLVRDMKKVPIVTEADLDNESNKWVKMSYAMAKDNGEKLFDQIGSGIFQSYVGCEPVLILFTKTSAIIYLNFRCNGLDRENGVGQILVAFEFSRQLGDYKTAYLLYSNLAVSRSQKDVFNSTFKVLAPIVKSLLN